MQQESSGLAYKYHTNLDRTLISDLGRVISVPEQASTGSYCFTLEIIFDLSDSAQVKWRGS